MTDEKTPMELYEKYVDDIAHAGMAINMVGLDCAMRANKMVDGLAPTDKKGMADALVFNGIADILKKPAVELTMAMVKVRKLLDNYFENMDEDEETSEKGEDDEDDIALDEFLNNLKEELSKRFH